VEARASDCQCQFEPRRRRANQHERSHTYARTTSIALGGSEESTVLGVSVDGVGDEPTQRKGPSERHRRISFVGIEADQACGAINVLYEMRYLDDNSGGILRGKFDCECSAEGAEKGSLPIVE
jgi:hypothetical protein